MKKMLAKIMILSILLTHAAHAEVDFSRAQRGNYERNKKGELINTRGYDAIVTHVSMYLSPGDDIVFVYFKEDLGDNGKNPFAFSSYIMFKGVDKSLGASFQSSIGKHIVINPSLKSIHIDPVKYE